MGERALTGTKKLVREALMRADEGSECLRNGEGEQEVRPGQLFLQVVGEPLLGFMLLTLGTEPLTCRCCRTRRCSWLNVNVVRRLIEHEVRPSCGPVGSRPK